jgi:hypothetical protein
LGWSFAFEVFDLEIFTHDDAVGTKNLFYRFEGENWMVILFAEVA